MTYDRFDDMRSKATTEGYDLSKIGTKITAQAQSPITKGSKWEGIQNTNQTLSISETSMPTLRINGSNDTMLTFDNTVTISGNSTNYPLRFYDLANNEYVFSNINLANILSNYNIDTSQTYTIGSKCNENSTLMLLCVNQSSTNFSGKDKLIVLEIDKENKTATPYQFSIPFENTNVNYFGIITENDIFIKQITATTSRAIYHYKYNQENHTCTQIAVITNQNSSRTDDLFANISFVRKNSSLLAFASNSNTILKLSFTGSSLNLSYTVASSPLNALIGLESNLEYVLFASARDTANGTLYVVPFDSTNLSFGTPISLSNVHTSTKAFMINNKILMYDSIYKFDGTTITLLVSSTNTNLSNISSPFWSGQVWAYFTSNSSASNKLFIISGDNGDYLISKFVGTHTQSSKYYGIASEDISLGNVGNAQLLFNT